MLNFREWLISELSSRIAREVAKEKDLHFDNIFPEGKTRIAIPFCEDEIALSIVEKIKNDGFTIDFGSGLVLKDKKVVNKLGKFINNKKYNFSEEQKYWFAHQGEAIPDLKKAVEFANQAKLYSVIISRSPIDIVRMSDHNWTSCHSPDGGQFDYAVNEARDGSMIAYVVKKEDLAKVNLDDDEIFMDRDRNIPGIVPISRLRFRRYHHREKGYDLAIPETSVYGKNLPSFKEVIFNWAFQAQRNILKNERPRMSEFTRSGGYATDTSCGHLFNLFFKDNLDSSSSNAQYVGKKDKADEYEDEINQINQQYQNKLDFTYAYASVEENDGHVYLYISGGVSITIPEDIIIKEFPVWSGQRKIKDGISEICSHLGIYSVNEIEINPDSIRVDLYTDEGNDPNAYQEFVDYLLRDVESKKEQFYSAVISLLTELGYVRPHVVSKVLGHDDEESVWDEKRFQNFEWDILDDRDYRHSHAIQIKAVNHDTNNNKFYIGEIYWSGYIYKAGSLMNNRPEIKSFANKLYQKIYEMAKRQVAAHNAQKRFFDIPDKQLNFSDQFNIRPEFSFSCYETNKAKILSVYFELELAIHVGQEDSDVAEAIEVVDYLDKNFDRFLREAQMLFAQEVQPKFNTNESRINHFKDNLSGRLKVMLG